MLIKNFQAETVSAALGKVKKELGSDAVILKTSPVDVKDRLSRRPKRYFQVTACVDDGTLPVKKQKSTEAAKPQNNDIANTPNELKAMLRGIQNDVRKLLSQSGPVEVAPALSDGSGQLRTRLDRLGFDGDYSNDVIARLQETDLDFSDARAVNASLLKEISDDLTDAHEIKQFAGKATLVALVGPPGSGKSSLAAKLASHFVARRKSKVKLVTLDDFKPGSKHEVERYASLLNVDFADSSFVENSKSDEGVVLIDTAGIPVGSFEERDELRERLERIGVDEIHLVLPSFCRWCDISQWYDFFEYMAPTAVAFTFMDQTSSYASALNLCLTRGIQLSYFSAGRTSAKDLETADAKSLLAKALGSTGGSE